MREGDEGGERERERGKEEKGEVCIREICTIYCIMYCDILRYTVIY